MFSRAEVTIPLDVFAAMEDAMRAAPKLMQTEFDRGMRSVRADFVEEAGTPLGEHKRPTEWQSLKQKRYWFWALKTGIITWTGRTGALEKGWRTDVQTTEDGGVFRVWNIKPYKAFVQGEFVQLMHIGVWPQEDELILKYQTIAEERSIQAWFTVSDPFGGIPQDG